MSLANYISLMPFELCNKIFSFLGKSKCAISLEKYFDIFNNNPKWVYLETGKLNSTFSHWYFIQRKICISEYVPIVELGFGLYKFDFNKIKLCNTIENYLNTDHYVNLYLRDADDEEFEIRPFKGYDSYLEKKYDSVSQYQKYKKQFILGKVLE
jgi:hypothetical protein